MRFTIGTILLLACAATAGAQNRDSPLFVDGFFFHDHETRQPGWSFGGGGAVGLMINPHFSIRFEAGFPGWSRWDYQESYPTNYPCPVACPTSTTSSNADRTITYGVLVGGHLHPHPRVELGLLGGIGAVEHTSRDRGSREFRSSTGAALPRQTYDGQYTYRNPAITLGLETVVTLSRHVAVVPEVRIHTYAEYGSIVRPQVAVRWSF